MIYVTMTDKFLSGWGVAKDKTNKLVFECETYEEAERVERNAKARGDMKNVNICKTKPSYNASQYLVQYKTKAEYPNWYK